MLVDGVFGCWLRNFRAIGAKRQTWQSFGCLFVAWHSRSSVENLIRFGLLCASRAEVCAVDRNGLQDAKAAIAVAVAEYVFTP